MIRLLPRTVMVAMLADGVVTILYMETLLPVCKLDLRKIKTFCLNQAIYNEDLNSMHMSPLFDQICCAGEDKKLHFYEAVQDNR